MMLCNVCGNNYTSASMGGPGICPSCDCGIPPQRTYVPAFQPSETYIGITPDQVRQIIREELQAHAKQHNSQR